MNKRKKCTGCHKVQAFSSFAKDRRKKDGLRSRCKACSQEEKLMKRYEITEEEYQALFEFQGGRCAICRRKPGKRRLAVDHEHSSGRIRGLLCAVRCNRALGQLNDNYKTLANAADYLAPFGALFIPPLEILQYQEEVS